MKYYFMELSINAQKLITLN